MSILGEELKSGWKAEAGLRSNLKKKRVLLKEVDPRKNVHAGMNSRHHLRTAGEITGASVIATGSYKIGKKREYNKRGSNRDKKGG